MIMNSVADVTMVATKSAYSTIKWLRYQRDSPPGEMHSRPGQRLNAVPIITARSRPRSRSGNAAPSGDAVGGHDGDLDRIDESNQSDNWLLGFVASNAPRCPCASIPCAMIVSAPAVSAAFALASAHLASKGQA